MLVKNTITKKFLEGIIANSFTNFGGISSSYLLDSLKLLGFYYATIAGISINTEDLRIPKVKENLLENAKKEVKRVNIKWQEGYISETERFETLIDNWNNVTEILKNKIINYYENFDPLNNLHVMAFSGARGNISQVRQLIGMRGLMADQEGNIIDLPIEKNFCEGLSSLDYIISSYGARKGIVDTALKTADSGYLTRRLIYLCQDLVVRENDCRTKNGLTILLKKNTNFKNLLGRTLLSYKKHIDDIEIKINELLNNNSLEELINKNFYSVKIRSPLLCNVSESVCQKCYGWNLAQSEIISLGEAVGVIAAQSIGEPGTQLTMRTFHTGGVFSSETLNQRKAPYSGRFIVPLDISKEIIRNNKGEIIYKINKEIVTYLITWDGKKHEIKLPYGSHLYVESSSFVKKDQILAEISTKFSLPSIKKLKPIYSFTEGEITFDKVLIRYIGRENNSTIRINQENSIFWLLAGKITPIIKEAKINELNKLNSKKAIAELKLISPMSSYYTFNNDSINLLGENKTIEFNYPTLLTKYKNLKLEIFSLVKNSQYLDNQTVFAKVYLFPTSNSTIYKIRKKDNFQNTIFFFITDDDIWKLHLDEINISNKNKDLSTKIKSSSYSHKTNKLGFLLKEDGLRLVFQKAIPIFLSKGSLLSSKKGDFLFKNQIIANIVTYTQQTQDIVQGLPKIEEIIEARSTNNKTLLASKSSVVLDFKMSNKTLELKPHTNIYRFDNKTVCVLLNSKYSVEALLAAKTKNLDNVKQEINLIGSSLSEQKLIYFQNKLWKITEISSTYQPVKTNRSGTHFKFISKFDNVLATSKGIKIWQRSYCDTTKFSFYEINSYYNSLSTILESQFKNFLYYNPKNKKDSLILVTKRNKYILLENFDLITNDSFSIKQNIQVEKGQYIDLAQPILEGVVDLHDILEILCNYNTRLYGFITGCLKGINKFQLILLNSIQGIYQSQGINIDNKHIEIVVRQMTSKVLVKESGDTALIPGEIVKLSFILELSKAINRLKSSLKYKNVQIKPLLISSTKNALLKKGFLSAAGFQETKRVLAKAAVEGNKDWITGLKESVVIGRLISGGSSFLLYKQNLDSYYQYNRK